MAASNWGTDCRLEEALFADPCEFDFFQAVRLLTLMREDVAPRSERASPPLVRFRAYNSLAFPASAVASLEQETGSAPQMAVTFLGMTGPHGTLPVAYTEIAIDRACFGDRSFADFLDIFNHRLIELFFEAWKKHRFVIGYEISRRKPQNSLDGFTACLFDVIGMGTAGLRGRLPVPDLGLLHYAGLMSQRPHSADALRAFLQDYFAVPVTLEQFVGQWHGLEPEEACSLGSGEASSELGIGAVAGDAVWSRQALVRVVFGPLHADQFRKFLPDGETFAGAVALIRWFLGGALDFEIQATLLREEVSPCRLGDADAPARLGWSAWLRTEPFWFHATDAIFKESEQVGREA
jgi:type VI secretion system protein ImpH